MPYDGAIFNRTVREIALSQRFKQNWHKLCGTFNLAVQMCTTNFIIKSLPRPIAFILLIIYLTILSILTILIVRNHRRRNGGDLDLIEVVCYRQKYMIRNWLTVLFGILMWAFLLVILSSNSNELSWAYSALGIRDVRRNAQAV